MKKTAKRQFGDLGEDIACKYYKNRGFVILERNYLRKWGEIDIVAEKSKKLYFIEVKTTGASFTSGSDPVSRESLGGEGSRVTQGIRPEENVHTAKLKRLFRTIQSYLLEKHLAETSDWQLDVACVYLDIVARRARVKVLENIVA